MHKYTANIPKFNLNVQSFIFPRNALNGSFFKFISYAFISLLVYHRLGSSLGGGLGQYITKGKWFHTLSVGSGNCRFAR